MHYLPKVSTALPACWTMQLLNASNSFSVCRTLSLASSRKMTTFCCVIQEQLDSSNEYDWLSSNFCSSGATFARWALETSAPSKYSRPWYKYSSNWHSRFRGIWRTLWEHVERWAPCISVQWHCSSSAVIGLLNAFMLKRWTGGHTFWHIVQYIIACTCVSHTQQSPQHPIAKERTCPNMVMFLEVLWWYIKYIHRRCAYIRRHNADMFPRVCLTGNISMLDWTWDVMSLEDSKSQTQRQQYTFERHV